MTASAKVYFSIWQLPLHVWYNTPVMHASLAIWAGHRAVDLALALALAPTLPLALPRTLASVSTLDCDHNPDSNPSLDDC